MWYVFGDYLLFGFMRCDVLSVFCKFLVVIIGFVELLLFIVLLGILLLGVIFLFLVELYSGNNDNYIIERLWN